MLPNFRKQSASLFELTVLDLAEGTINKNVEHTIFTWKTSSPFEVKNHDQPPVGFSLNPLNGQKRYKGTPTVTR